MRRWRWSGRREGRAIGRVPSLLVEASTQCGLGTRTSGFESLVTRRMGECPVQTNNRASRSVREDAEIVDGMDAKDGEQKSTQIR
jgi:hypothetical protein